MKIQLTKEEAEKRIADQLDKELGFPVTVLIYINEGEIEVEAEPVSTRDNPRL